MCVSYNLQLDAESLSLFLFHGFKEEDARNFYDRRQMLASVSAVAMVRGINNDERAKGHS